MSFQGAEGLLDLLAGVHAHFRPFSGPNSRSFAHFRRRETPGVIIDLHRENAENEDKIDDTSDEDP